MRNKLFLMFVAAMVSLSMFAAVGPQSIKVTFNGGDSEGWYVPAMTGSGQTSGTITSVADGYANVTMGVQNAEQKKFRADFQYNNSDANFTFDKTKDIVWAIKLKAAAPGTGAAKKLELAYKNAEGSDTYTGHQGSATTANFTCADGIIYYFDFSNVEAFTSAPDGNVMIKQIHFTFADGVIENAEDAHYSVDWVATFSSVNDLKAFQNWKDEAQEATPSLPYLELLFRPKSDGSGYDKRCNGFENEEMEGNWHARMMVVEYFLVEDYSLEKIYTLALTKTGNYDQLAVWNFPYQVNYETPASDINTMATAVVGYAPGNAGTSTTAIASASCTNNVWSFTIPAYKLTPLATVGSKTLVGVLVTTAVHDGTDKKGKFASACHTSIAHPSLTYAGSNPVVNITQLTASANLSDAVSAANAGDVIELRSDVTISGSRLEIKKELTIQGATGAEKIICGVAWNVLMVLANDDADYTVTFRNVIVDGQNTVRDRQLFDSNGKAKLAFEGVSVINTSYSVVTGDVKCAGSNIILSGTNSFPTGIYLNRDKRIDNAGATHTSPIRVILSSDYREDYAIVLHCNDASLYEAVDAAGAYDWELRVVQSGSNKELKGRKIPALTLADDADNAAALTTYDGQTANVTLSRTITCNGTDYATFCVPFDIDAATVAAQLGNPELLRYHHAEIDGGGVATFYFTEETAVEAGVPYLIKPEAGATLDLVFKGVTIDNSLNASTDGNYQFMPVFSLTTIANASDETAHSVVYLSSGNQLKWAANGASLKGMRAYFRAVSPAAVAAKRMVIGKRDMPTELDLLQNTDEQQTTKAIENGQMVIMRDGAVYNTLGARIR